jgi:hypothetical protein
MKAITMQIEQALYGNPDAGGYRFLARSAGFAESWLGEAERLCTSFGDRPAGVLCPLALFARPFGLRHVAVVQAADQGVDDAGRPGALAFHLLIVPRRLYAELGGDLFLISDKYPPVWDARGEMPTLEWTDGTLLTRSVDQVRRILNVVPERTQTLLGGVQVLVDGGRLVFVRKGPDPTLVRDLWELLPNATRAELWPATFAFGNRHGFHVVVVPDSTGPEFEHYVKEEDAGDYPEGRYEYALQKAAEESDQNEIDSLFARRSRGQTLRLALVLLAIFAIIPPLVMSWNRGEEKPALPAQKKDKKERETLQLPPAAEFAPLTNDERKRLAARLSELGTKLDVRLPKGSSEESLRQVIVELDRRLDEKLGANKPPRLLPKLDELGPAKRRLRALLWKYGVEEYAEPGLNPVELVERLEKALARAGAIKEDSRE